MGCKTYDIELSYGCLISLDGGGETIPCCYEINPKCKWFEEYMCSPSWVEWEIEIYRRNNSEEYCSEKTMNKLKEGFEKTYNKNLKILREGNKT